jgi:hypothetical protein
LGGGALQVAKTRYEGQMRAFEFHEGEVGGNPAKRMIVDLDFLVMLQEIPYEGRTLWTARFSGVDDGLVLAKPAFDRILLAWKSN